MVPIYHVAEYLPECIDSVIEQTYECFELIHVDDGSTDESGIIYDTEDSRIIVIHKVNSGLTSTRNAGLEIASGNGLCTWAG